MYISINKSVKIKASTDVLSRDLVVDRDSREKRATKYTKINLNVITTTNKTK